MFCGKGDSIFTSLFFPTDVHTLLVFIISAVEFKHAALAAALTSKLWGGVRDIN